MGKLLNNKWKAYFFTLFFINILTVFIILGLIFWPKSFVQEEEGEYLATDESSKFIIRTTKENLNELINAYIDELTKDNEYRYWITLDEDVLLEGEIPIFSVKVPLSISFDPYVLEDGNIVLKQKTLELGRLKLPNQQVMKYMEWFFEVPSWVKFYPQYEEIHLQITKMDFKSNFHVQVEQFNLINDQLAFKIEVPYETLGLDQLKIEKLGTK